MEHNELYWQIWNHKRVTHKLRMKISRYVFLDSELELILSELNKPKVKASKQASKIRPRGNVLI